MSNPAAKPRAHGAVVAAVVCALAGVALFQRFGNAAQGYVHTRSLFWWWLSQWIDPNAETQHGWLVLAIAAWLLWRNRRIAGGASRNADGGKPAGRAMGGQPEGGTGCADGGSLPSAVRHPAAPAAAALVGALALHTVGFAAQQARISIVALLLFLWGVVRLAGGRRWGAAATFPLAFMGFAIPLNALDTVGFWLRLWVIDASRAIARLCHVGVIQSGTQLIAADGRYHYDVAAACSGVRSLMVLAALSLLVGYLVFRSWRRRALMLLLCFPLVYLGNVVRISAIVLAANWGGPAWGDKAHDAMGWVVFGIVLGGVLAAALLLERVRPEGAVRSRKPEPGERRAHGAAASVVALVVVALAAGDAVFLHHLATMPPRGGAGVALAADGRNPIELPALIGGEWVGWPAPVTAVEREVLPPDTGYSRMNYVPSRGSRPVFLSIVLSGRDRTSIHRPELCLVGQGWTITGRGTHRFAYPGQPDAGFAATVLRVQRPRATRRETKVVPQIVAYWFVSGDGVVATHWQRFLRDAWNRVVHGRADRWAYVLAQTDASDGDAAALARVQTVLDGTLPIFQPAVPAGK